MKIEADVIAEASRLAATARIPLDSYVTHALRHYNRFHALTKNRQVRWVRDGRVAILYGAEPPSSSGSAPNSSRPRNRK